MWGQSKCPSIDLVNKQWHIYTAKCYISIYFYSYKHFKWFYESTRIVMERYVKLLKQLVNVAKGKILIVAITSSTILGDFLIILPVS